jgi:hypothetical protein
MKSRYLVAILLIAVLACLPGTAAGVDQVQAAGNNIELVSVSDNGTQAKTWNIQTVDSYDNVGLSCSLGLDKNGNPHISYLDSTNCNLKYAKWNGSAWDIQTVDSSGNIGYYTSIALDKSDKPHISYHDFLGNRDLKYAYWNGSAWTISIVDSEGVAGMCSSIAIDSNDNPHISYVGNNYLKYARWNGSSWVITTVDTESIIGNCCSIALDSNDCPHISYDSYGTMSLKYAYWNGSAWITSTLDTEGEGGPDNSIAVDKYGNAHISYYDGADCGNNDLKYAHWNGSAWDLQIVDSVGNIGAYNSLALDSIGNPHITYYDNTNNKVKYARWDGSTWCIETVTSAVNTVYRHTSLALDKCDIPHIAYYEDSVLTKDLKYATKNQSCQDVATSTGTGTATFATDNGTITGLTAVSEGTLPAAGKPTGVTFPHGLFSFNIINITPGSTVIVTITFPSPIPVGAQYWKYQNGNWIDCTSLVGDDDGDDTLTLTLTDGGLGDADGLANGIIVDPGGPAIAAPAPSLPSSPHASPSLPRQLNEAQISLQYLAVNPEQAYINQPLTITGNVVNNGDFAGNYNLALKINGKVEETRMVSVGPRATQPVKFTVTKSKPGTYNVNLGSQLTSFTVIDSDPMTVANSNSGMIVIPLIGLLIMTFIVLLLWRRRTA